MSNPDGAIGYDPLRAEALLVEYDANTAFLEEIRNSPAGFQDFANEGNSKWHYNIGRAGALVVEAAMIETPLVSPDFFLTSPASQRSAPDKKDEQAAEATEAESLQLASTASELYSQIKNARVERRRRGASRIMSRSIRFKGLYDVATNYRYAWNRLRPKCPSDETEENYQSFLEGLRDGGEEFCQGQLEIKDAVEVISRAPEWIGAMVLSKPKAGRVVALSEHGAILRPELSKGWFLSMPTDWESWRNRERVTTIRVPTDTDIELAAKLASYEMNSRRSKLRQAGGQTRRLNPTRRRKFFPHKYV